MGKASKKENKTPYQLRREALGLTREKASELLESITVDRLERIESGKVTIQPEDVLEMARKYNAPHLCNFYCAHDCRIGQQYVPEVKVETLPEIVLKMVAALNAVQRQKEDLIAIAADGTICGGEVQKFIEIQAELENISLAVESLQLWTEQMLASGTIDKTTYNAYRNV